MRVPAQINASAAWPQGAPHPHGVPALPACQLHLLVRHRARRELRCSLLLAQQTIQPGANHGRAAFRSLHPGPHLPWRLVSHMLRVPTLKLGYPLTFGVLVKSDDLSPHTAPGESSRECA
jgi:hypothetical protein